MTQTLQRFVIARFFGALALVAFSFPLVHAEPARLAGRPPADFSDVRGRISVNNQTYVNANEPAFSPSARDQNLQFELELKDHLAIGQYAQAVWDMSDAFSTSENWNYGDVHELYVDAGVESTHFALGRKLETWDAWETVWPQGFFQPRYMQDPLRPEVSGLTGLFLREQTTHWNFTLAALPIHIPDLGPHFSVTDDKFVSRNPWFQPPAGEFLYNHVASELHYALHVPRFSDLVFKPGVAAKTEFHNGGALTRLSYAYKPIPQLALGFPSNGLVQLPNYAKVVIYPRVIYDRIFNLDEVYERGPWSLSASVAYDNPESDHGQDSWTMQSYTPSWIFSGTLARHLEDQTLVEFSFLKVSGGDGRDTGSLADVQTKFTRRFEYYEAYLLGLKKDLRVGMANPVATEIRVIYDRLQDGGIVGVSSEYAFLNNWRVELNLDLIGLLKSSPAQINDGFLATFRANDRFGLGVSYVF